MIITPATECHPIPAAGGPEIVKTEKFDMRAKLHHEEDILIDFGSEMR
jgi:hypothetical protein